jgi:hypothetical protein
VAAIAGIRFLVFDAFIKPPTIVANWQGGMVDHEISKLQPNAAGRPRQGTAPCQRRRI